MDTEYASVQDEPEALHDRTVRLGFPGAFSVLLFLRHGAVGTGPDDADIEGPMLLYWPADRRPDLTLRAGSSALLLGLSDAIVLDAIGARSESVHLRMLIENSVGAPLAEPEVRVQVAALCDWFGDEMARPDKPSPMSLSAYLRLLFICALRVYRPAPLEQGSERTDILRRFRHLVELHYRAQWSVAAYADSLGVAYDRLHRICKRETGRSPAELVHERLTAEAKARLENSGFPLKKIAADLGFADATRFSHFFKRRTGMAPGAYRAVVTRPDGDDLETLRSEFADWP